MAKAGSLTVTFGAVLSATNVADRNQAVLRLQQWLSSRPKDEAAGAIRQFLAFGQDARTGQGFQLNADGSLRQAPTLRTLLLGMLGKLDPAQAAAAAKEILQRKDSADEWAAGLALYARANSSDDALYFLQQKAEEMAGYQPWQTNPCRVSGSVRRFCLYRGHRFRSRAGAIRLQQRESRAGACRVSGLGSVGPK